MYLTSLVFVCTNNSRRFFFMEYSKKRLVERQLNNKYDNKNRLNQEKRTERLGIRLRKSEKDAIVKKAIANNISISDYALQSMFSSEVKILENPTDAATLFVMLNQQLNDLRRELNLPAEVRDKLNRIDEIRREYVNANINKLGSEDYVVPQISKD